MIDRIQRLGGVVRFAPQGGADILGREVGANVDMGMIDNLDRSRRRDALHEKTQIFAPQVVRNTCRAREPCGIEGVIAVLFVHASAYFVYRSTVTRADEKATTL